MVNALVWIRSLVFVLVLALPSVVWAGHYDMEDADLVEASTLQQLAEIGIANTEELLDVVKTSKGREMIVQKTDLDKQQVQDLARTVELLQVRGVGPKAARLLKESGVVSVSDLAGREGQDLLERLILTNQEQQITGIDPDLVVVTDWITRARDVPVRIE